MANACLGIFVPTLYDYVAKKLKRQKCPQDTLSNAIRLEMLKSLCKGDNRLTVSRIQMNRTERGYDYEMLVDLQKECLDDELYFVTGSDKLYVLSRWHRIDELLRDFRVLVAKRGEDDLEQIKQIRPYIAEHWDSFTVFPISDGIKTVSFSLFRERLHRSDKTAEELVTQEVWEIMDENGKLPFTEYGPGKSKGMGAQVLRRLDWEQVKVGIMEEIVRAKFTQHPELARLLIGTGDKILAEGNHWGDTC